MVEGIQDQRRGTPGSRIHARIHIAENICIFFAITMTPLRPPKTLITLRCARKSKKKGEKEKKKKVRWNLSCMPSENESSQEENSRQGNWLSITKQNFVDSKRIT